MKCNYGCNKDAKYKTSNGKDCCSKHYNSCPAIRKKNSDGVKKTYINGRISAFTQEDRDDGNKTRIKKAIEKAFVETSTLPNGAIRNYIFEYFKWENKCSECGINEWNNKPITLDLGHINGINTDNRITNLRLLCPNCHRQTDTHCGKNINTGKIKVTDLELLEALKKYSSVRKALMAVGLSPKGGNYNRCYKLLNK